MQHYEIFLKKTSAGVEKLSFCLGLALILVLTSHSCVVKARFLVKFFGGLTGENIILQQIDNIWTKEKQI